FRTGLPLCSPLFPYTTLFRSGVSEGSPALPNTGSLIMLNKQGGFDIVAEGLDRPTSFEMVGNTAYIVTLTGEVWIIDNVGNPPLDRKSTRLNSSHVKISYAVF